MMPPSKLLPWAEAPEPLKVRILHEMDEVMGFGKTKHRGESYFSDLVAKRYGIQIAPNHLRAVISNFRREADSAARIPSYIDYLNIKGDWAITSDWQVPFHDHYLVMAMVGVMKKIHGIKNLVLAGDFWDNLLYGKYLPRMEGSHSEDQFRITERLLEMLYDEFDFIIWMCANHEYRLIAKLDNKIEFQRLARMVLDVSKDKLLITEYPYLHINNKWRVTHPRNFSRFTNRVANAIAAKYRMSVMCAHGHRFGMSFDDSGQEILVDTGGLFDITKMSYVMLSDSTAPVMNPGFVALENNHPYLYAPGLTDWKRIGIDYDKPNWLKSLENGGFHVEDCDGNGSGDMERLGGPEGKEAGGNRPDPLQN